MSKSVLFGTVFVINIIEHIHAKVYLFLPIMYGFVKFITSKYIKKWLSVLLTAIFFNILHFQKVHILAFYEKEGICYT